MRDYEDWAEKEHAQEWFVFPESIGSNLCIDETEMSNGDLFTIVSNPQARGRKGSLVAIVSGVQSDKVIAVLQRIPEDVRLVVQSVTLDMSNSMNKIVRTSFPNAIRVVDRFDV